MAHLRVSNKKRVHPGLYSGPRVTKELFKPNRKNQFSLGFRLQHAQESTANGFWSFFGNKRMVLGLVLIAGIIGGLVIASGPAFHSQGRNPLFWDPHTQIWSDSLGSADLSGWNSVKASYQTETLQGRVGVSVLRLVSDNNGPAIAISKSPFEASEVAGKNLHFGFTYYTAQNLTNGRQFGFFITRNNTVSLVSSYDPGNDANVAAYTRMSFQRNGLAQSTTLLNLAVQHDSNLATNSEGYGATTCAGGAGIADCAWVVTTNANVGSGNAMDINENFNYTGTGNTGGSNGVNTYAITNGGTQSVTGYPWFAFQGIHYFIGVYVIGGSGGDTVDFSSSDVNPAITTGTVNCLNCMFVSYFVPTPATPVAPSPTIDTGGFFGPLINALVSIGVFVVATIGTFFNYIFQAFKVALDTMGNFLGIGLVGTQLTNVFSAMATFVTSVFSTGFTIISNTVTFLVNSLTAITNVITTYWTQLSYFLSDLTGFLGGLWTVLSAFLQYGSIALKYGLMLWWVLGMTMAYRDVRLFINLWTKLSFMFVKIPFDLGMWFYDTIVERVIYRLKFLIFGWT